VIFLKYGPRLLDAEEYNKRLREMRREYHRTLAHNVLRIRPDSFWQYHKRALKAFDAPIDWWLVARELAHDFYNHVVHPIEALKRGERWWVRAWKGRFPDRRAARPQSRESRA